MPITRSLYYPNLEPPLGWLKAFLLFNDGIVRIVPPDSAKHESLAFRRFREAFPDAISDIESSDELVTFNDRTLGLLDRAFATLPPSGDTGSLSYKADSNGYIESIDFPGHVFLHRSKVAPSVVQLMMNHELAPVAYQFAANAAGVPDDWLVVRQEASHLVLSLLAARVACDRGLHSVTDSPLDYSCCARWRGHWPQSGHDPRRADSAAAGKRSDRIACPA